MLNTIESSAMTREGSRSSPSLYIQIFDGTRLLCPLENCIEALAIYLTIGTISDSTSIKWQPVKCRHNQKSPIKAPREGSPVVVCSANNQQLSDATTLDEHEHLRESEKGAESYSNGFNKLATASALVPVGDRKSIAVLEYKVE